jgi:hypothetical protein
VFIISFFGGAYNISEIKLYIKFVEKSVIKRTKKETSCLTIIDTGEQSVVIYGSVRCFSVRFFLIKIYCLVLLAKTEAITKNLHVFIFAIMN